MNTNLMLLLAAYYAILGIVYIRRRISRHRRARECMTERRRESLAKYWKWCN